MLLARFICVTLLFSFFSLTAYLPYAFSQNLFEKEIIDYSISDYLIGTGVSDPKDTEAKKKAQAEDRARAEIAKQIRTEIKSKAKEIIESKVPKGDKEIYKSLYESVTETSVDLELEGIKIVKEYFDKKGGIYYTLAVLNKKDSGEILQKKINQLIHDAIEEVNQAKTLEKNSSISVLKHYFSAKIYLLKVRRFKGLLWAIAGVDKFEQGSEPSLIEICTQIEKIFQENRENLDLKVTDLAYQTSKAIDPNFGVMVDKFTYKDTKFAGPFAFYLSQEMEIRLPEVGGAKLIERRDLSQFKNQFVEQKNLVSPELLGSIFEANAVLYGNYQDIGDEVVIRAFLSRLQGDRLAQGEVRIKRELLEKNNLSLFPSNYENLQKELDYLKSPVDLKPAELSVQIWTDHGDGGMYRKGDKMFVFLMANKDCYVRLIYHQADGKNIQIFPNPWREDNKIEGNRVYIIPSESDKFEFTVDEPYGAEVLKAFASSKPFPKVEGEFFKDGLKSLMGTTKGIMEKIRGIRMQEKEAEYTEAECRITTFTGLR